MEQKFDAIEIHDPLKVYGNVTINGELLFNDNKTILKRKRVVLNTADIQGMYATPIKVIDGVVGKRILVMACFYYMPLAPQQFSGGGSVNLFYDVVDAVLMGGLLSALSNTFINDDMERTALRTAGSSTFQYSPSVTGKGVLISNFVGAFTAGANNTLTMDIIYLEVAD